MPGGNGFLGLEGATLVHGFGGNTFTWFRALRLGLNAFLGFGRCRFGALTWGATLLHGFARLDETI